MYTFQLEHIFQGLKNCASLVWVKVKYLVAGMLIMMSSGPVSSPCNLYCSLSRTRKQQAYLSLQGGNSTYLIFMPPDLPPSEKSVLHNSGSLAETWRICCSSVWFGTFSDKSRGGKSEAPLQNRILRKHDNNFYGFICIFLFLPPQIWTWMKGDAETRNSVGTTIILLYKCILYVGFDVCGSLAVSPTASAVFGCWGSVKRLKCCQL